MDKNMSFVEETAKEDKSSKQGSDGEMFVNRVTKSGVLLKFKVGKYGSFCSSSNVLSRDLTFSGIKKSSGEPENFEANTQNLLEPLNNEVSFLDSATGTNPSEEISCLEMLNNGSKEVDHVVSLKSVAMDTHTTGIDKTSEDHVCHQCGKSFKSIDSFYGHIGCHRREEYKQIRVAMQERPFVTETSDPKIEKHEIKNIWKASKALLKVSNEAGCHPVHSSKATDDVILLSSTDISEDTADMMEVAEQLIKLSQTVRGDVVKVPASSPPSVRVFKCTQCNKTYDSYQALGGHISSHNKQMTHKLVGITAGNSSDCGVLHTLKHSCSKCNDKFPTGQSLGGHKRKHNFEVPTISPVTDEKVIKGTIGSQPHYTMQASGAVLPVLDDLRSTDTDLKAVDDTVTLLVPKDYHFVQPLQANNLAKETELASGVDEIVVEVNGASNSCWDPTR